MLVRQKLRLLLIPICIAAAFVAVIAGWLPAEPVRSAPATATVPSVQPTPTDAWKALQQSTPFPYTLPLPPPTSKAIDGTYVKQEPSRGEYVHCLRCPDWLYEGGLWKMRFDRGIYRVFHADMGWRTIGSYAVSGDRLILFNDPNCLEDMGDIGVYRWKLEKGVLTFQVIDDPCAIELRGKNLTHLPWQSCRPPNVEAGVTDHWVKPEGCE